MKIVRNNIIPFKGFAAINICGTLFVRENIKINDVLINHEEIHTAQMKELGYFLFYLIYLLEWLFRALLTKDAFSHKAYRNISFEKEAYDNQNNLNYLKDRHGYAMWK